MQNITRRTAFASINKRDVSQELRDLRAALLSDAVQLISTAQQKFITVAGIYSRSEADADTLGRLAQFSALLAHEAVRHLEVRP
jgi:hypothetical protein